MSLTLVQRAEKLLQILSFVVLLALLNGCAVSPESRLLSSPASVRLEQGQGLVVLKITNNVPPTGGVSFKWQSLRIRNIESAETKIFPNVSDTSAWHSLFVGALPAGNYQIEQFSTVSSYGTVSTEVKQVLPKFRVEPTQLTNLGSLVQIYKLDPANSREFQLGQADSPFDSAAIFRQLSPTVSEQIRSSSVNSWEKGEKLENLRTTFTSLRSHTMHAMSPVRGPNGEIYLGESFGLIRSRSISGVWRQIKTPIATPIRALHVDSMGAIYAGSDEGLLMVRRQSSGNWDAIQLPVNDASVIFIGTPPRSKQMLVILQTRDRFIGMELVSGTDANFREVFTYPRKLFYSFWFDAQGAVLASNERLVLAISGVDSVEDVGSPLPTGGGWKFTKVARSGWLHQWAMDAEGNIGYFDGNPFFGMNFFFSQDGGVTFEKRSEMKFGGPLLLVTNKVGYVVGRPLQQSSNSGEVRPAIWRTDDAGRTWKHLGPIPVSDGRLLAVDGSTDYIAYAGRNGMFFVSKDGGKNWLLERTMDLAGY